MTIDTPPAPPVLVVPAPPPAPRQMMRRRSDMTFWLVLLVAGLGALYLLRTILLPFVAGMAVAYFLDPIADRLERRGLSRTVATIVPVLAFFLAAPVVAAIVVPLIGGQVVEFAQRLPDLAQQMVDNVAPLWQRTLSRLTPEIAGHLRTALTGYTDDIGSWIAGLAERLLSGSLVVVDLLSLLFITPVVAFYLLRDWHRLTAMVDSCLPRRHAETIRGQFRAVDDILAGYVRGQALVCLTMAIFYAIFLSVIQLDLGLVIGFGTGLLVFVPYLGTSTGFVISAAVALSQPNGTTELLLVLAVFGVGNVLEGYVLVPRLVGENIGLHPVWVIFALLAGGALFGLLGILLALPTAAVVGVVIRFSVGRYKASTHYVTGEDLPSP